MHRWRESKVPKNSKDTQHIFVCEQKATGQHLLVARKMSGLQLKLNLTFYKGVETETWMINFTILLHAVSSKAFLLLAQESENFNWNHD